MNLTNLNPDFPSCHIGYTILASTSVEQIVGIFLSGNRRISVFYFLCLLTNQLLHLNTQLFPNTWFDETFLCFIEFIHLNPIHNRWSQILDTSTHFSPMEVMELQSSVRNPSYRSWATGNLQQSRPV